MSSFPTYRQGRSYQIGDKAGNPCAGYCGLFLLIILSLGANYFLFVSIQRHFTLLSTFSEVKNDIRELPRFDPAYASSFLDSFSAADNVIHFATDQVSGSVVEDDFNLEIEGALSLTRTTEYCQWNEIATDRCDTCYRDVRGEDGKTKRESYSCNCVRTYNYIKKWQSYRVNSFLFNQPATHNNPQRDPFPSRTFHSHNAMIENAVRLEPSIIEKLKGKSNYLQWGNGRGVLPPELYKMYESVAFRQHHFVYAGNGYFFSPYEISTQERLVKMFFQWFEGSLLDFQLGDLMPSCTAGDIRVYYSAISPKELSGLGRLTIREGAAASIGAYTTSTLNTVALLREGKLTAQQLMDAEAWDFKKVVYLARLVVFVWCLCVPSILLKCYVGCLQPVTNMWGVWVLNALSLTGLVNFMVQLAVSMTVTTTPTGFADAAAGSTSDLFSLTVGIAVSLVGVWMTVREWQKKGDNRFGGTGACKRLIWRYCGGPVSWYEAPIKEDVDPNK